MLINSINSAKPSSCPRTRLSSAWLPICVDLPKSLQMITLPPQKSCSYSLELLEMFWHWGLPELSVCHHFCTFPPSRIPCMTPPGSFPIFLLGTSVCCSLGDGNVPGMVAMQQEPRETGNLRCQPPGFPSRAMLGAFPALTDVSLTIPKVWIQPLPSSFIPS